MKDHKNAQKVHPIPHHSPFFGEGFRLSRPRRKENTCDSPLFASGGGVRCRLFCLRSDKLLCIRRIATPFSSVEKLNPRCTERMPVDISVLLADSGSTDGLRGSIDVILSVREVVRDTTDGGRFSAFRPPPNCASWAMSRVGSNLEIHRMMSMSSGAKPNFKAFAINRGASERQTVSGRHSQK